MPRKESEAVPEGNGPVLQQEQFGSDQPTLVDVYHFFFKDSKDSHGGRRASKREDSQAHGGHRYSSSSDAWG